MLLLVATQCRSTFGGTNALGPTLALHTLLVGPALEALAALWKGGYSFIL